MKDLRIVIVSWNVAELLERCVTSLPDACRGLDWDCVVVDNASADASVKVARHVASEYEEIHVIENLTNVGFGMACNQGVASRKSQVESRYILFLNPDTFCHPDSIARFIHLADERPKAGILGPKLTNPDGRAQESIRRFPDVWSQAGILLKLHHLFPGLPMFKKYFARDLNPEQEQVVEQVMGACFLVRRACWDAIGGFDERFFIWFEEVDRCLAATKKGWEVRYLPQVQVVHHGGESFAQVFTTRKQRYFNESLIKYFQKWQPTWQSTFLRALAPIGLAEAWVVGVFQRHEAARWIALTLGVESFSFSGIFKL